MSRRGSIYIHSLAFFGDPLLQYVCVGLGATSCLVLSATVANISKFSIICLASIRASSLVYPNPNDKLFIIFSTRDVCLYAPSLNVSTLPSLVLVIINTILSCHGILEHGMESRIGTGYKPIRALSVLLVALRDACPVVAVCPQHSYPLLLSH